MASMLIFLCTLGVVALAVSSQPMLVHVPMRYVTTENMAINSNENTVFQADIGCDSVKNGSVEVCAELPHNWEWNPFKGYVYLNLFNDSANVGDLSKALASTGRPHQGKTPNACVTIQNWPGGSLFARVDASNFSPVIYTISVQVGSTTTRSTYPQTRMRNIVPPAAARLTRPDAAPMMLTPVATHDKIYPLEYNNDVTFALNVCFNQYQQAYKMTSSVLAMEGLFTHFICGNLPCTPNSANVLCSENSPRPAGTCTVGLNSKPQQVYVTVYSSGGAYNTTTKTYVGSFKFGTSFTTV